MNRVVQCFGVHCEFDVDHLNPLEGPIIRDVEAEYNDDFEILLIIALQRLFVSFDRDLILSCNKGLSVAQWENGGYSVANSHAVDNTPDGRKNATVSLCKNTKTIAEVIKAFSPVGAFYNLFPLVFSNLKILSSRRSTAFSLSWKFFSFSYSSIS